MYLSQLQLLGFKSFAQKTKLEFNHGISCIIGPNGSGKSNIVDAIRWVLGEQRTSALRSDKMENVIFNGTKLRKPVGIAEVSMTIQDNLNILNTEYREVVISRRLFRSGDSEYLINNTPVRLKDVLDLFMDTGMGANSYSVIELKMVESILSENKAERRLLFEEAAGVVKYKLRRKSALRNLEASRLDLTRIGDIITEVDKNVQALQRQVGKARRYLEYAEGLRKNEIDLSRYRYHVCLDGIRPLKLQLQEVSKLKEESHHQITMDEALLEDFKREQIGIEHNLQNINREIHDIDIRLAQLNQEQAVGKAKAEEMAKTCDRYKIEIEDFSKKIELINENLTQYEADLLTLHGQKEVFDQRHSKIEADRSGELERLQTEKADIDQLNRLFRNKLESVSSVKDRLKEKEYQLQFQKEQLEQVTGSLPEAEKTEAGLRNSLTELGLQRARIDSDLAEASRQQQTITQRLQDITEKQKELERQRSAQLIELERVKSQIQFFQKIIINYEGHSRSAQYIMKQKDQAPGIYSTVADLISGSGQYTRIVELVLNEMLNYIVVENESVAEMIIDRIRREKQGRITLIPLNRIADLPKHEQISTGFDLLIRHIDTAAPFRNLIELMLGNVAICASLSEAIALSKEHPGLRFVTLQGELINYSLEISGGYFDQAGASIIGRKEQLKRYSGEMSVLETRLDNLDAEIKKLQEAYHTQKQLEGEANRKLSALQRLRIELEKNEAQFEYEIGKRQQELNAANERTLHLQKNLRELETQAQTMREAVGNEQQELNELERQTILRTNQYERNNESMQSLMEEVQKSRLNAANLHNQINNRKNDIQRAQKQAGDLTLDIQKRETEITRISEELLQMAGTAQKREAEQHVIWELRDKHATQQEEIEHQMQAIREKIHDLEEETRKYRRQHDSSLERTRSLELKIAETQMRADHIREYIQKEYSEDIEIGIPFDGLNEPETEEKIEMLRARIRNLGPVNPLAVSEYEKEKERFDFLTRQRDDLLKAEQSLMETIDKINKTARLQFMETFEKIRSNFERVFQSFFENGEGTIFMEEQEDPLEAEIEIQVRTKGKRLQTLTLLSGGEKTLTAISLLFAIYLVKPSPFCILDEVDAPLDDVNIGRFTEALKRFSGNTQFIIVTHNKRTMESAETMYGVTMEEEGVSKLVSVKFN
jgi:chromosome segregation protein